MASSKPWIWQKNSTKILQSLFDVYLFMTNNRSGRGLSCRFYVNQKLNIQYLKRTYRDLSIINIYKTL